MVTLMQINDSDLELIEAKIELESLGITDETENTPETDETPEQENTPETEHTDESENTDEPDEPENTDVSEQKPLGTLSNGVVLLSKLGVNDKGYVVYEAVCPFCGKIFEDARPRLSQRGHCGCQTYERRSKAQAKGVVARLTKKFKRKPYDPNHVPFEKSMSPEEKAGWSEYLNKTMKPGGLAIYADMPQSHREVLASLIAHDFGKVFEVLEYILKDLFIELLDLCQSERVEFPTRGEIRRRIAFIRLFEQWKNGKTPEEIAYELCDDVPNIVSKLRLLQDELRDFQKKNTYVLNDWWCSERFFNLEINGETRFQSVVLI
jgi:hypothetical protein